MNTHKYLLQFSGSLHAVGHIQSEPLNDCIHLHLLHQPPGFLQTHRATIGLIDELKHVHGSIYSPDRVTMLSGTIAVRL